MVSRIPENDYIVDLGKADIKRKGSDITIVAVSYMVHKTLAAAEKLEYILQAVIQEVFDWLYNPQSFRRIK